MFLAILIVYFVFIGRRKQQIRGSIRTKVENSQRLSRRASEGGGSGPAALAAFAGNRASKKNGFHRFEDEDDGGSATAVEMGPNSTRDERTDSTLSSIANANATTLGSSSSSSAPAPPSAPSTAPGQQQEQLPGAQVVSSQVSFDRTDTIDEVTDRI